MTNAPGYPDRSPGLNALPGFQNPPPGYGEVPFWWWTGEDLNVDRMLEQVRELGAKAVSGFQVNYSHYDTSGWPTDSGEPKLFTDAWWKIYGRISEECGKLGMGIGLSTYTLDWPNGADNLFYRLFYSKPELNAVELVKGEQMRASAGTECRVTCAESCFAARAYEVKDGLIQRGGIDLTDRIPQPVSRTPDASFTWTPPEGEWEVWTFGAARHKGTLNPMMTGAGQTVIDGFYQEFQRHNPGGTSKGLNFFFNDELKVGVEKFAWNGDFADEFRARKGYDLLEVLPAMWTDIGDITPKVRIDYADVRMSLMEERYFEPIYNWHASRGIIYGCDNEGRGLDPHSYGDYFRATRWYSAPGHDTPGGNADPIKGKVSSSIANLYSRPRVQLEGYHSLGWGATLERMMFATRENYLYGCNLFSLHGFYYTTYGSHWEWAPPCYHFRMPYWKHIDTFLKYYERLSYIMSQGHHVCDVAVIYPVTPYEAEAGGIDARDAAFELGRKLLEAGIDFDFIDHQSIERAVIEDGHLAVRDAGAAYKVLVFPDMRAARWNNLEKAAAFSAAGGMVICLGEPPSITDRAGRNDPELAALNERAFPAAGRLSGAEEAVSMIGKSFTPDFQGLEKTVRAAHRRIGPRDVYMVMDAEPGDVVAFRAKGRAELWDPWSGDVAPLRVVRETVDGTEVVLPLENYEAQVVVFTPGETHVQPDEPSSDSVHTLPVTGEWRVAFEATMDNRYGDFRLPVTDHNRMIGVEARRFQWLRDTEGRYAAGTLPEEEDQQWSRQLHGHGPQFHLLGPVPEVQDPAGLDPAQDAVIGGQTFAWRPYEFSWREGLEGDPGHQGFHGMKGTISENFIRLGRPEQHSTHAIIRQEEEQPCYYLWSTVHVTEKAAYEWHVSVPAPEVRNTSRVNAPAAVFLNGKRMDDLSKPVMLEAGTHRILLHYGDWGESHVVLRRAGVPVPEKRTPLSMHWYDDPGVLRYDPFAGVRAHEWFRFTAPPGTAGLSVEARSDEPVAAWIDGAPMTDAGGGTFTAAAPCEHAATVLMRLKPPAGYSGGAAVPEPVRVETSGTGIMAPGDWSEVGILHNFSGGVRYQNTFELTAEQAQGTVVIDLGRVIATAEVRVNGREAGVRVAPPWRLDISEHVRAGTNELEVTVYNTLANHYQTLPSFFKGDPSSGLFGPVAITVSGKGRAA